MPDGKSETKLPRLFAGNEETDSLSLQALHRRYFAPIAPVVLDNNLPIPVNGEGRCLPSTTVGFDDRLERPGVGLEARKNMRVGRTVMAPTALVQGLPLGTPLRFLESDDLVVGLEFCFLVLVITHDDHLSRIQTVAGYISVGCGVSVETCVQGLSVNHFFGRSRPSSRSVRDALCATRPLLLTFHLYCIIRALLLPVAASFLACTSLQTLHLHYITRALRVLAASSFIAWPSCLNPA